VPGVPAAAPPRAPRCPPAFLLGGKDPVCKPSSPSGACVIVCGCLLLVGSSLAGDKKGDKAPDRAKLYGVWEVLRSGEHPLLSSAEFRKKRLIRTYFKGGATTTLAFDYTLEGNKLTTTIDTGGR
jgi:hypothetical protein